MTTNMLWIDLTEAETEDLHHPEAVIDTKNHCVWVPNPDFYESQRVKAHLVRRANEKGKKKQ
jgi:hypothetical protein